MKFYDAVKSPWDRRQGEDALDQIHRLARGKLTPDRIADKTHMPVESVIYVMQRNGYPR